MRISPDGINLIKSLEGCSTKAYKDGGGVWTIGYGFTEGVKPGDVMTQDQIDARLAIEIQEYEKAVSAACVTPPTQRQFDALVSITWNIGISAMKGSTFMRRHNQGNFQAAAEAFKMWNQDNGKVVQGLVNRRAKEANYYLS